MCSVPFGMSSIAVEVRRAEESVQRSSLQQDLERVRQLASVLDAKFQIAGIRFGWDAIVGLVPVVGDVAMAVVGTYPLYVAHKHKLGKIVRARMIGNLALDWAVGAVPLVGDLFDVAFKAHLKNARLLEQAVEKHLERSAAAIPRPAAP